MQFDHHLQKSARKKWIDNSLISRKTYFFLLIWYQSVSSVSSAWRLSSKSLRRNVRMSLTRPRHTCSRHCPAYRVPTKNLRRCVVPVFTTVHLMWLFFGCLKWCYSFIYFSKCSYLLVSHFSLVMGISLVEAALAGCMWGTPSAPQQTLGGT